MKVLEYVISGGKCTTTPQIPHSPRSQKCGKLLLTTPHPNPVSWDLLAHIQLNVIPGVQAQTMQFGTFLVFSLHMP
jgi:hypothetical protein